jgi:FkbM family methyltransferase
MYKVRTIPEEVDGVGNWTWVNADVGVWHWPKVDWLPLKDKYLKHCSKFDVVVQAGGACGMYPRLLAEFFHLVYTFEPDPYNFHCLVNNCQLDRIYKIQAALGDESGTKFLHQSERSNSGMHRIKDLPGSTPVVRLDDLNLPACDLLSLDVEEYEVPALLGAEKTIQRHKPVIVCECLTSDHNKKVSEVLKKFGYGKVDSQSCDVFYKPI